MHRTNLFTLRFSIFMLGLAILAIAVSCLSGLVFEIQGVPLLSWGDNLPPIAVPTIIALILTGTGFILLALSDTIWKQD